MSGGTRSYEMARRFVTQGHQVHMVTSWREPSADLKGFDNNIDGICVHWLPVTYSNHMSFTDRIKAFFKFAFKSAKKITDIKADLIFATSTPLTIALPAVFAAKRHKIPMIFEVRDLWPELPIAMGVLNNPVSKFLAKRLELFAYNNSAAVVALSPGMKEGVIRTGYPSEKVAVIPNSSDIDTFRVDTERGHKFRAQREWLGDNPLLIYTGTFGLINGVGYMVDLAFELNKLNSDVCVLLIGEGLEFEKVTEYARTLGVLNKNLYIEKSLPKRDIPAALSAATMASVLFIDKPEMRPNSANKFFDALAAAKPVMTNFGGWMHDLVETHDCGLAMWRKPIDLVAYELEQKIHDTEWVKRSSKSSFELAQKYFDRDDLASQLLSVLLETSKGCPEKAHIIAPGDYI